MIEILSPIGVAELPRSAVNRLDSTEAMTIGVIENGNKNAEEILGFVARGLADAVGGKVEWVKKLTSSSAAPDEVMARLAQQCQLILAGTAD